MHDYDDDEFELTPDGHRILKDKRKLVVPMRAMDSLTPLQRSVARDSAARFPVTDGQGRTDLHTPGFRVTDAYTPDARQRMYDVYDAEISSAYLNATGAGSRDPIGQREGDIWTIDGSPGHLRRGRDGALRCVPDHDASDASRRRKVVARDPQGRESESWETEEESNLSDASASFADLASLRESHARLMSDAYSSYDETLRNAYKEPRK